MQPQTRDVEPEEEAAEGEEGEVAEGEGAEGAEGEGDEEPARAPRASALPTS